MSRSNDPRVLADAYLKKVENVHKGIPSLGYSKEFNQNNPKASQYEKDLVNEIDNYYSNANLDDPNYDDTWVYSDQDEDWYDRFANKIGEKRVYDLHDKYLTDHGVDLNQIKRTMAPHEIKALFKKEW